MPNPLAYYSNSAGWTPHQISLGFDALKSAGFGPVSVMFCLQTFGSRTIVT